jgi:hypothetical protein
MERRKPDNRRFNASNRYYHSELDSLSCLNTFLVSKDTLGTGYNQVKDKISTEV